MLEAQFLYVEKGTKYPLRKEYPSGEVDFGIAKNSVDMANKCSSFEEVFPHVAESLMKREGVSLSDDVEENDNSGLQAMVMMTVMASMNLDDARVDESRELVPFLDHLKIDPDWAHALQAFGAVLLGIQDHKVKFSNCSFFRVRIVFFRMIRIVLFVSTSIACSIPCFVISEHELTLVRFSPFALLNRSKNLPKMQSNSRIRFSRVARVSAPPRMRGAYNTCLRSSFITWFTNGFPLTKPT